LKHVFTQYFQAGIKRWPICPICHPPQTEDHHRSIAQREARKRGDEPSIRIGAFKPGNQDLGEPTEPGREVQGGNLNDV
jgi:hypothetical protein